MQLIDKEKLEGFAERLSYRFTDINILAQALIHRSFINEKTAQDVKSNERFEFLGDAILSAVISRILLEKFPDADEGRLSKFRARLVNESTLARLAADIELGRFLLLGKGEEITGGREKPSILSDAYEAVIAAVYLDGGFEAAFSLISRQFSNLTDEVSVTDISRDYKTELQEEAQEIFKTSPRYRLISDAGPEHDKIFEAEVLIGDEVFGSGRGKSKKEAEQMAAMAALERLKASR